MRYGVISDIHANLPALEAVLAALERVGVDALLCPGDVVGYGPRPNECAARLAELGVLAVSGNHDLMALGELSDADLPPLQRRTIDWTRRAIDDVTREYLAGLPATRRTADGIVIAHGSLDSPRDYVRDCVAGVRQLGKLAEREPGARCLVLGHTHRPLACGGVSEQQDGRFELRADPWLVNPGAVGQSRERAAVARGAVIDLDLREVHLLAIEYDVREVRRQLRDAGLPVYAAHLAPGRAAKWRRRLGLH